MLKAIGGAIIKKACEHIGLSHEDWTRSNVTHNSKEQMQSVKMKEYEARTAVLATEVT